MGLGLRPGAKAPDEPPTPYWLRASPRLYWRVPIPVQTQAPPCGTSAVLTTTCATMEALA